MKHGSGRGIYWVKPGNYEKWAEYCDWCFRLLGSPDDIILGTTGRWFVRSKYGLIKFRFKEDQLLFRKAFHDD